MICMPWVLHKCVQHIVGPELIVIKVKERGSSKAPPLSLKLSHALTESINAQVGAAIIRFQ